MYRIEVEVFKENFHKEFSLTGNELYQLKQQMYHIILDDFKVLPIERNAVYDIEFSVEFDGEYYDHDEGYLIYDFQKKSFIIQDDSVEPIHYRLPLLDVNYFY